MDFICRIQKESRMSMDINYFLDVNWEAFENVESLTLYAKLQTLPPCSEQFFW